MRGDLFIPIAIIGLGLIFMNYGPEQESFRPDSYKTKYLEEKDKNEKMKNDNKKLEHDTKRCRTKSRYQSK